MRSRKSKGDPSLPWYKQLAARATVIREDIERETAAAQKRIKAGGRKKRPRWKIRRR